MNDKRWMDEQSGNRNLSKNIKAQQRTRRRGIIGKNFIETLDLKMFSYYDSSTSLLLGFDVLTYVMNGNVILYLTV